ncbi:hypothetical protein H2201_002295 [Coniosporium apollinis]|uniref:ubiquitinyl hydrolase 1 n=1 Tax=Coniosporium apollinis TaxID=61459 RepID=A0ABQ9NYG8_9PEZI|nr:hypothetical protein H2201_002295 [Coniosporium apollinis]
MPMVAAVLADTKRLHRVVVPKALLLQTAQLLQARLGGLLGREVRHVPFSRKTPTDSDTIKEFYNIHREMLKASGLMLALPEHILSFMLSGLQRLSDGRIPEANQAIKVQAWMRNTCRDVLDECDVTLAVRTQLIYPSGSQMTVDGHPHRWQIAEALLELVGGHLWNLQTEFPQSIEVVRKDGGGFPVVFFLRADVEDALIVRLVNDICNGQLSVIPTRECTKSDRLAIKQFISGAKVRQGIAERINRMFPDKPVAKQSLYLLRGLLVHRILLLALKKRWNVQYSLHPNRDPIAVPFHAKGVPSEQAEWGHPDVAILFTCLAFYYGGLLAAQLRQSLEHLLKSDDPSNEYDRWTNSAKTLPGALQDWNAINVDDEAQLMEIWKHVRYDVVVIDYFLNNFVFPKHAKQFQMKLQASGWDIPLLSPADKTPPRPQTSKSTGRGSQALTTGFSGTNGNRTMLPLTIRQEDLPRLSHTNAEVLTYLLKGQSRQYVLVADSHGRRLSELELLKGLTRMEIRILIDAGAQILEMDNLSLVKAWLDVFPEAPAAVFFDNENKAIVRYRHGLQVPLLASPFADNLADCLVYLDEAHTRGTDLKLPTYARGALTLGLGQTKDHTVQAAMRLRQLATTQSVCFFAPPEVHQSILDLCKKKSGDPIDSYDVIRWLLEQTCDGIEQLQPLYFSQGVDFCRRTEAASEYPDSLVDKDQRDAYLNALRQVEKQTLEQLYKPKIVAKSTKRVSPSTPQIAAYMKELNTRRKAFQDTGGAVQGSALQEVEQEREVAHEVEAVREVQKPVHYSALSFPGLHRDIASFVQTGRLAAGSAGYEQAFVTLRRTALGIKNGVSGEATASKLYVSAEFTKTIKLTQHRPNDNFLRPVNWILWSSVTETAILVIPEEAELIIPLVYQNQKSPTHLLTYSVPVTRKMLHFNSLDYYAMPGLPADWQAPMWLKIELGIFAGRLYFEYDEYDELRKFLGLHDAAALRGETTADAAAPAELDGTNEPVDDAVDEKETDAAAGQMQSFTNKPLSFLQEWLAVRRKGQEFVHTPMGYVCQGKSLTGKHPFFSRTTTDGAARPAPVGMAKDQGKEVTDTSGVDEDDSFDEDMSADGVDCDEGKDEDVFFDQSDLDDNGDFYDEEQLEE